MMSTVTRDLFETASCINRLRDICTSTYNILSSRVLPKKNTDGRKRNNFRIVKHRRLNCYHYSRTTKIIGTGREMGLFFIVSGFLRFTEWLYATLYCSNI